MIGVAWINIDPKIASARLRSLIPRQILYRDGLVQPGLDVIVAAKHGWDAKEVRAATEKMVFDICDDHFHDEQRNHYMQASELADVVTCNSEVMREVILAETGRDAIIIDDPYEDPELEPTLGNGVLWFGHKSNAVDLQRVAPQIKYPISIVGSSNYGDLDKRLKACQCVVIPTGKSMAKSANRAIRAIRYGKYPVCGELPAYSEIKGLFVGDVIEGLDYYMNIDHRAQVKALQDEIRVRFDPEVIAKKWYRVLLEA